MTEWILTSSVLILLVITVRGLFRNKMKAKYVYALWLIVLVRLLCPVNFGELSFNLLSLAEEGKEQIAERIEERETLAQPEANASSAWEAQKEFYESHGIMHIDSENPNVIVQHPVDNSELPDTYLPVEDAAMVETEENGFTFPEINWQKVLPVLWIAGMASVAAIVFCVNISFGTTLGIFRKELPVFTRKGRGKTKLSVYLADGINSSCLYGVVRPSIYLNRKEMGEKEINYCVEHEYSHYLQGDMAWSLCRAVCLILHWYNPLVWLAVVLSKKDAELACDECTIERLGEEERFNYGHTLVELAAGQSTAVRLFSVATLIVSDKKEVVDRVKAITTRKQTKVITGFIVAVLVVAIGCFVFTGEAKGEQDNNTPTVTATPVPTKVPTVALPEEPTEAPEPTQAVEPETAETEEETAYVYEKVDGLNLYQKVEIASVINGVEYQPVSFTDKMLLEAQDGQGWLLDLDGDGTEDRVYWAFNSGLYINNKHVRYTEPGIVYFLDIDTTDGMYEIAIDGNAYYYDGTSLLDVTNFVKQSWSNGASFTSEIENFERVDEHTICFLNYNVTCHAKIRSNFVLNEKHQLVLAEGSNVYNPEHEHAPLDIRWDSTRSISSSVENYEAALANQTYTELSFTDHIRLESTSETGWSVDLDGDGTKEQICFYGNELCINGKSAVRGLTGMEPVVWLLDIDTTDGMYEILLENGTLWIYDGSKLNWVWALENFFWKDGCVFQGTLNEFSRVDEHTISFYNIHYDSKAYDGKIVVELYENDFAVKEYQYCLNENHELVTLDGNHVGTVIPSKIMQENAPKVPLRIYEKKDLSGEYIEVQVNGEMFYESTQYAGDTNWHKITLRTGESGWAYREEGVTTWHEWYKQQVEQLFTEE